MLSSSLRFTLFRFALTAGVLLCVCLQSQAKKLRGDVVVMKNGDRLTGDLKSLQSGVQFIETAYSSENIGVDWNQVQTVQSKALYLITLANGVHLTGSVERTPDDVKVVVGVTIKTGDKISAYLPRKSLKSACKNRHSLSSCKVVWTPESVLRAAIARVLLRRTPSPITRLQSGRLPWRKGRRLTINRAAPRPIEMILPSQLSASWVGTPTSEV